MDRKAQIQVQFNWIFVIIVGAIILGFFLSIIFSQQEASETKISVDLANHFNTIITTTNQKIGTVKQYKVPKVELNFVCLQGEGVNYYSVGEIQVRDTKHELYFSAETLQDDVIYTWTQEWRVPYGIGTFLYLTNSESMYAFVTNASGPPHPFKFDELTENFANNLTTRFIYRNSTDYFVNTFDEGLNMDDYTYIFLDDHLPRPGTGSLDLDIVDDAKIIVIDAKENDVFAYGNVSFLNKEQYIEYYNGEFSLPNADLTAGYIGKASLYAAIFSGDRERYICGMDKALERFRAMNYLHYYKIQNVLPRVNSYCSELLNGTVIDEDVGLRGARDVLIDINDSLNTGFEGLDVEALNILVDALDDYNSKIAIESNCPLVY